MGSSLTSGAQPTERRQRGAADLAEGPRRPNLQSSAGTWPNFFAPGLDRCPSDHRTAAGRLVDAGLIVDREWHHALRVAEGEMDPSAHFSGGPWDHAALVVIAEEAGNYRSRPQHRPGPHPPRPTSPAESTPRAALRYLMCAVRVRVAVSGNVREPAERRLSG